MKIRFLARVCLLTFIVVAAYAVLAPAPPPALAQSDVRRTEYNPSVDEYTVREGDTLWAIAGRIVGSSSAWPKVWSYNPEIANPNWIYPGDTVFFYDRGFEFPSLNDRPELASRSLELEQDEIDEAPPESGIQVVKRPSAARRGGRNLYNMFITEKQLEEAGKLVNAEDDAILIQKYDTVFLRFPDDRVPKRGEEFMLYRTVKEVLHPVNGGRVGYLTEVTGFARVGVPREDGIVTAEITDSVLEIDRGQMVTPKTSDLRFEAPKKLAANTLEGFIVAVHGGIMLGSQYQMAFIDVGTKSGVEAGNEFVVFRESDRHRDSGRGNDLPLRPIGLVRVASVNEQGATVFVLDSIKELEAGQQVRAVTQ